MKVQTNKLQRFLVIFLFIISISVFSSQVFSEVTSPCKDCGNEVNCMYDNGFIPPSGYRNCEIIWGEGGYGIGCEVWNWCYDQWV